MLEKFLKLIEFTLLFSDQSVFINSKVITSKLILAVYVDDFVIAKKYKQNIVHIKHFFKTQFEVKGLTKVQTVINIWVKRYNQQITLNQLQYIVVIFKKFLDNIFLPYFMFIELDAIHKLANTKKKFTLKKKSFGIYKQLKS